MDQSSASGTTDPESPSNGTFKADASMDSELGSEVIRLDYADAGTPDRSLTVAIAPALGSNMFQFRVGAHELLTCDRQILRRMGFTGNFVLWPLPNRITDKTYIFEGQTYSLKAARPGGGSPADAVLVHGLVYDLPWRHDPPVVAPDSASVTTYIDVTPESPFYDAYPFNSRLSLTYRLGSDGVTITYAVHNTGSRNLPYGFALHPYFGTLSGPDSTLVRIPATQVMEADDSLLPTPRILDVDGVMYAMFDLRQAEPVGHLKLDHVYTGLTSLDGASIEYRQQAMSLRFSTSDDFTHVVLYTPPHGEYFCLEHQTCATDAVNLHARGRQDIAHLLSVGPGETRSGFIRYIVDIAR